MGEIKSKRIALNTLFLYFRMCILMLVAFYTSRVLIKELGIDDYGIYGVVGGVVAIFSSLRVLFATATQRFLNFEMGKGNVNALNKIFNISIIINIGICILFFIVAESIGLWLLNHKLVIAVERLSAANWVFHFSVLASMVTILTIPFDAVIIAHEKMSFYAYISILDAILKLGIIFILSFISFDKLKLYAILVLIVSLIIRFISSWYCSKNFAECRYKFCWDKELFKEMSTFAGWNFAGNFAFALVNEGLNILLNLFGGVVANAARSIAYQIKNAITTLLNNIIIAIQPQATQLYAQREYEKFYNLLFISSKIIAFLYLCIAFPIYFYVNSILSIWLGTVPQYSVLFIQSILIYLAVRSFHATINTYFFIIGKLKIYQLCELMTLSLSLPISYIGLKIWGWPLVSVFYIMGCVEFINLVAIIYIAKKVGDYRAKQFFMQVLVPYFISLFLSVVAFYSVNEFFLRFNEMSKYFIIFPISISLLFLCVIIYFIGLSSSERSILRSLIRK